MYLSICLDRQEDEAQGEFRARAQAIEALAPDMVLLARDDDGVLSPPRVEGLVDVAWLSGILKTPLLVAGLPALHSYPFHVARALSAADFLSDGRTGWMPLVGNRAMFDGAYGSAPAASDPGARADDFVRATRALWDSWDDDALVLDKAAGTYLDSSRVRRVDYKGSDFSTMGPLNAARPPQGHPLLVRDGDDCPASTVQADIIVGQTLPPAATGTVRLLKVAGDTASAAARVADGEADGLLLCGTQAVNMLEALRANHGPALNTGTARQAFGLPHPINPFSARKAA